MSMQNGSMGMGAEGTHPVVLGVVTVGMSEQNQRGFYKRWAELTPTGVGTSARGK